MNINKQLVFGLLLTVMLIGLASAYPYRIDACRTNSLSNSTINFTVIVNSTYNQTFTLNVPINISCDNSRLIQEVTTNLTNASAVSLYMINGVLYFDNITTVYANVTWIRQQFDSWYISGNASYTKQDSDSKYTIKSDTDALTARVTAAETKISTIRTDEINSVIDNPQFGAWWKVGIWTALIASLASLIILVKLMFGGSQ